MGAKVKIGLRVLLGLIFFVFGLNGFLQFLPMPPLTPEAGAFMGGLAESGYFFPLLKATEVLCGALLLVNRFVPLALVVLAPIIVNILFFHLFLDTAGMPMTLFILFAEGYLAFAYRSSFAGVIQAKA